MVGTLFTYKNKAIIALLFVSFLTACGGVDYNATKGRHMWSTPEPAFMSNLPQGDDSYSRGVRDGCNTFLGLAGVGMVREHKFAYDANRGIEDRDYYVGYRIGADYCTYYTDVDPL